MFGWFFSDDTRGRRLTDYRRRPLQGGVERLEARSMFAVSDLNSAETVSLLWDGWQAEAKRDAWLLQMPQPNAGAKRHASDYASHAPKPLAGWHVRDVGFGFYEITAPGASQAVVSAWAQRERATSLQPNFIYSLFDTDNHAIDPPNDTWFDSEQWAMNNTGQVGGFDDGTSARGPGLIGADIDALNAWEYTTGSRDVIVAVLDNGIDYSHPDLAANMWRRPAGIPEDRYGLHGWDSANKDGDVSPRFSSDDHGTHVAGTIGAVGNNNRGYSGVAWETSLYGAKVFADGSSGANTADIIDGIRRIVDLRTVYGQNIVAINASLGGYSFDTAYLNAVRQADEAGILFVAAAGNGRDPIRSDRTGDNNDDPKLAVYPANFDAANVLAVAASNRKDELTQFSNWGIRTVDIAAPGSEIWSTTPGGGYGMQSGTSMAAPHVTGVAALLSSYALEKTDGPATARELAEAILKGADIVQTLRYTESKAKGDPTDNTQHRISEDRRLNAHSAMKIMDDLLTPRVTITADRQAFSERVGATQEATFTIRLSRPIKDRVEVSYATVSGTAAAGTDFAPSFGTIIFDPKVTSHTISVPIINESQLEDDESFSVVISNPVNAKLGDKPGQTTLAEFTILNDELPQVSILPAAVIEATGGRSTMEFTLSIKGGARAPISLSYATADDPLGGAKAGKDYVRAIGTVQFLVGETTKKVAVSVIGDRNAETDEWFNLVVTSLRNGDVDSTQYPNKELKASGYILDDDSRFFSIRSAAPSVVAGSAAQFIIELGRRPGYGEALPDPALFAGIPGDSLLELAARNRFKVSFATANGTAIGGPSTALRSNFVPKAGTVDLGYFDDGSGGIVARITQSVDITTLTTDRTRSFTVRLLKGVNAGIGTSSALTSITPSLSTFASFAASRRSRRR